MECRGRDHQSGVCLTRNAVKSPSEIVLSKARSDSGAVSRDPSAWAASHDCGGYAVTIQSPSQKGNFNGCKLKLLASSPRERSTSQRESRLSSLLPGRRLLAIESAQEIWAPDWLASKMPALPSPARSSSRGVLSPRPAPRQQDAVVVVAQEALAAAALGWQERAKMLLGANARLKDRVREVESAHRKSLAVVKNVPALPNNHVFTKQLVNENHALRQQTRELQRRLMQFQGPGATRYRTALSKSARHQPEKSKIGGKNKTTARVNSAREKAKLSEKDTVATEKVGKDVVGPNQQETSSANEMLVALSQHPLVHELKTHLQNLEVDVGRLRRENELLRTELEQYQAEDKQSDMKRKQPHTNNNADLTYKDSRELQASVAAQLQQMKVLEAQFRHLHEKSRAKAALYQESTTRLEEMNAQMFAAQQQLAAQAEKLHAFSDQSALVSDLQQENHLLQSENLKLNEAIATLSSRPFDALSNDLHKKNIWIAQLEEEKHVLEEGCVKIQSDCAAIRRVNGQLRRRIKTMNTETRDLADQLSRAKAGYEQQTMEKEVAQLQLRFYTSPSDYVLMSAVGKALKEMKKKEASTALLENTTNDET